jgi:signal peptidase I
MRTALLLLSAVLAGWVAIDAARRGRSWYAWSRLVFFTSVLGLAYWFVARRRSPLSVEMSQTRRLLLAAAGVPLFIFVQLLGLATTTFVVSSARVTGQAMTPTLPDGSRLAINRLPYAISRPRRGEIVMFRYPLNPEKLFVMRVIAEEGDAVQIKDGKVLLNQVEQNEDAYVLPTSRTHDDWGPAVVPEGYLFVMGDHRNNSSDSRHWGFLPRMYVLGRVIGH